jgi:hypothetical protein
MYVFKIFGGSCVIPSLFNCIIGTTNDDYMFNCDNIRKRIEKETCP